MAYKDKIKKQEYQHKYYLKHKVKYNKVTKLYGRNQKRKLVELFGGVCALCLGEFPIAVYDFHHLNPKEKEYKISSGNTFSKILEEVKKCIMLCSNCHRIIHSDIDYLLLK